MGATLCFAALRFGSASADLAQAGYDAAQTGAVDGDGPEHNETALIGDRPGYRPHSASPVIIGKTVYALTSDAGVA